MKACLIIIVVNLWSKSHFQSVATKGDLWTDQARIHQARSVVSYLASRVKSQAYHSDSSARNVLFDTLMAASNDFPFPWVSSLLQTAIVIGSL